MSRPSTKPSSPVAGIGKLTSVQRKTPAPYALRKSGLKAFQFCDSLVNALSPGPRKLRPIRVFWNMVTRQLGQFLPNLLQGQPDLLRKHNECDAAENCAEITTMTSS